MNKVIFALTLVSFLLFTSCNKKKQKVFRIGSTTSTVNILNNLKSDFKKAGLKVEIIEFSDYTSPNLALAQKKIDMNFFQHKPFLDAFKKSKHLKLTALDSILIAPIGIYSKKIRDIKYLKDGAVIGLPNDPSNLARCLLVLQDAKLIKLDSKKGLDLNIQDIIENKKHLRFQLEPASKLPDLLKTIDATFINDNFAASRGINIAKSSIYKESATSPYANILAVRTKDKDNELVKKIVKIIKSKKTKDFLKEQYGKKIIPTY